MSAVFGNSCYQKLAYLPAKLVTLRIIKPLKVSGKIHFIQVKLIVIAHLNTSNLLSITSVKHIIRQLG